MGKPMEARTRGFTLIELLVAISVLAIVAVLGWRGLDSIVRARVALNSDLEQTRGLQLAFAQMQSDSSHVARPDDIGGRPWLMAQAGRITLVRTVFTENQPSQVQVVAYRLQNGVLSRRESVATRDLTELDRSWAAALADTDAGQAVPLRTDVSNMTIRSWVDLQGQALAQNPAQAQDQTQSQGAWRVDADSAASQPDPAQRLVMPASATDRLRGLEVSLRLQGQNTDMVKVFLLGAA